MTLQELHDSIKDCQRCRLASGRTQVVFGTGNPHAKIMFVGEAPGFYEDKQGIPFVGAAGKLLDELLEGSGLSRNDVYIANVIKCPRRTTVTRWPTRSRPASRSCFSRSS